MDLLRWAAIAALLAAAACPVVCDWVGESLAATVALVRPFF